MGKKKQSYTSFHLHLSNQLRHLPRKLAHLRSDPPTAHVTGTEIEGAIFDSFRSLGLSDCNLNINDQLMLEPAQYNGSTAVIVPPSDRFFVSPSMSGSLAWDCNCNVPLQASLKEEEEDLTVTVPPSCHRFFVSPSTSGLITLDQRVVKSSEAVQSPFSFASNSTVSDQSVLASSSASNSAESDSMTATEDATSSSSDHALLIPGDGIAVSTDSVDPYQDFKRSMQEMLVHYYAEDARRRRSGHQLIALDWDLLEELLFCYLELNNRSMHRYIIKAFVDVVGGSCFAAPPCCHRLDRSIDGEEDQINN